MSKKRVDELLALGLKAGDIVYVYYFKNNEFREERCKVTYKAGWYFLENLDYVRNACFLYGSTAGQPSSYRLIYKERNKKKAIEELISKYKELLDRQLLAAQKTAKNIEILEEINGHLEMG